MSLTHRIPDVGEPIVVGQASPTFIAKVTVGSATTNDITVGEIATHTLFAVDETALIMHVWTQVNTAFTSSVTLDIGDTGSAARFTSDTTINPAATGAVLVADTGLTVPYVFSVTDGGILLTVGGATVAAGQADVYIEYALLRD
jgi:hypothetical protein